MSEIDTHPQPAPAPVATPATAIEAPSASAPAKGWNWLESRLTVPVCVAAALVGIWVLRSLMTGASSGAAPAAASQTIAVPVPSQDATPLAPQDGASLEESRRQLRDWLRAPALPPGRNLFAFARVPKSEPAQKSTSSEADAHLRRQDSSSTEEPAQSRELSQIHLQSTIMGAHPRALINGQLVGEGDVIAMPPADRREGSGMPDEFRVLSIEARRVIVEHNGVRLDIPMD